MRPNEIVSTVADTDPLLRDLLLRLHKGAVATFNAKKTAQVLSLFPGWTMTKAVMLKPSDETKDLEHATSYREDYTTNAFTLASGGIMPARSGTRTVSLHASALFDPATGHRGTTLQVSLLDETEARTLHANVAKYAVNALPAPTKAKSDTLYVMHLSDITVQPDPDEDRHSMRFVWSFEFYRKCQGYTLTAPDGQSFDVCGPVRVLGYAGTTDFAAFFKWALANTNLEEEVNAKLGLARYVPASERPRVPVGSQVLGTCAICLNTQVVRNGVMVNHGYQRPGHGYIVGECFGVGYKPYEMSAEACVAYLPRLEGIKANSEAYLASLLAGAVTQFTERKRNYRTNNWDTIVTRQGDQDFAGMLKAAIASTQQQISYVIKDIAVMQARITDWKLGVLRRNEA